MYVQPLAEPHDPQAMAQFIGCLSRGGPMMSIDVPCPLAWEEPLNWGANFCKGTQPWMWDLSAGNGTIWIKLVVRRLSWNHGKSTSWDFWHSCRMNPDDSMPNTIPYDGDFQALPESKHPIARTWQFCKWRCYCTIFIYILFISYLLLPSHLNRSIHFWWPRWPLSLAARTVSE